MARRGGIKPMADDHVNVTPLIDVVMCLIIFFLLVGQLSKDEKLGNIKIPKARMPQEMVDSEGRLIVNVPAQFNEGVDSTGSHGIPDDYKQLVIVRGKEYNEKDLTDVLRKEKHDNPNLSIALRADSVVSYLYIAPVLISCAQANISSVNFATQPGVPEGNTPVAAGSTAPP